MVGLTLVPESSGSLVKPQPVDVFQEMRDGSTNPFNLCVQECTQSSLVPGSFLSFAVWYGKRQKAGWGPVNKTPWKYLCKYIVSNALGSVCKYQHRPGNDTTVPLKTTTRVALLTSALEDSGSLAKIQPMHTLPHL